MDSQRKIRLLVPGVENSAEIPSLTSSVKRDVNVKFNPMSLKSCKLNFGCYGDVVLFFARFCRWSHPLTPDLALVSHHQRKTCWECLTFPFLQLTHLASLPTPHFPKKKSFETNVSTCNEKIAQGMRYIQMETFDFQVTGVVGRAEIICSIFFLAAFIFYTKAARRKKSTGNGRRTKNFQ